MFKFLSGELLNDFLGRSRNRQVGLIDCGYTRKENQILNQKIIAGKLQISQSNETGIWKHPRGVYKKNRLPFQTFLSQLFYCLCAYHKKVLQSLSTKRTAWLCTTLPRLSCGLDGIFAWNSNTFRRHDHTQTHRPARKFSYTCEVTDWSIGAQ